MHELNDNPPTPTSLESSASSSPTEEGSHRSGWLKVGVVAAASALAGGLAAAWHYRKTLARLRQADGHSQYPDFRIPHDEPGEED